MLLNCANSKCPAQFLYLYEGELFILQLPNRTVERYWLCKACSPFMRVVYDLAEGVKVIPKGVARECMNGHTNQSIGRTAA